MKIIGIDPAPTKGLHVFDGEDDHKELQDAPGYLTDLTSLDDVLLCWDAPLTGPPPNVIDGAVPFGSVFSQRPIESFFQRRDTGFKTPKGISVRGYAGCPHWALSRSLIGLPRVGRFDAAPDELPFRPLLADQPPRSGRHVVEVHPAVAIWLWCGKRTRSEAVWLYKKSKTSSKACSKLWSLLMRDEAVAAIPAFDGLDVPDCDDTLDARIAFALGYLWLERPNEVMMFGDAHHGTFLLPKAPGLEDAFGDFAGVVDTVA